MLLLNQTSEHARLETRTSVTLESTFRRTRIRDLRIWSSFPSCALGWWCTLLYASWQCIGAKRQVGLIKPNLPQLTEFGERLRVVFQWPIRWWNCLQVAMATIASVSCNLNTLTMKMWVELLGRPMTVLGWQPPEKLWIDDESVRGQVNERVEGSRG